MVWLSVQTTLEFDYDDFLMWGRDIYLFTAPGNRDSWFQTSWHPYFTRVIVYSSNSSTVLIPRESSSHRHQDPFLCVIPTAASVIPGSADGVYVEIVMTLQELLSRTI